MSPLALLSLGAFMLGAILASFVNLVAWRMPLKISVVQPPSSCPKCGSRIPFYALVPILGYLFTRGACAHCRVPISFRYPLVELIGGLLSLTLWLGYASSADEWMRWPGLDIYLQVFLPFLLELIFALSLLALLLMDLDWLFLPDRITLPLALLGLLRPLAVPGEYALADAAYGALLGGGLLFVVGFIYALVTGRAGLGGGDWKLGLALGAWLGPEAIPFIWLASSVGGLLMYALFRQAFAVKELPLMEGEEEDEPSPEASDSAAGEEPETGGAYISYGPLMVLAGLYVLFFGPGYTL